MARAALLYFILADLSKLDHMYQFSLSSFVTIFVKAMYLAEPSSNPIFRENSLVDSIIYLAFKWTMRDFSPMTSTDFYSTSLFSNSSCR
jgi:dynein heavy chain